MSETHPDWAAIGATVTIRRLSFMGRVDHERQGTVTRHTPKGIVVDDNSRFVRRGKDYVETPKYLSYVTLLLPAEKAGRG